MAKTKIPQEPDERHDDIGPDGSVPMDMPPEAVRMGLAVALISQILIPLEPWEEAEVLAMLLGEHLACVGKATVRKGLRDEIIRMIDEMTQMHMRGPRDERKMDAALKKRGTAPWL